uniref:Transcription repressor OFP1-like n=1 Tax=Rhizophora mucronata TaxID=61149 RepID=A0A2P2NHA7_RHIMU
MLGFTSSKTWVEPETRLATLIPCRKSNFRQLLQLHNHPNQSNLTILIQGSLTTIRGNVAQKTKEFTIPLQSQNLQTPVPPTHLEDPPNIKSGDDQLQILPSSSLPLSLLVVTAMPRSGLNQVLRQTTRLLFRIARRSRISATHCHQNSGLTAFLQLNRLMTWCRCQALMAANSILMLMTLSSMWIRDLSKGNSISWMFLTTYPILISLQS